MAHGRERVLTEIVLIAACGLLLGLPALLLNGFPLLFDDSPGYFEPAFHLLHPHASPAWLSPPEPAAGVPFSDNVFFLRPFPYAVFLLPFAGDWGIWLIPVAQGTLAALVIRRALEAAGLAPRPLAFAGVILALALLTSLPVHAGHVMPDVFTGLLILAAGATVLGWAERGWPGRLWDGALLAFLTAVHLSHVAILAGLIVVLGGVALVRRRGVAAVALGLGAPLALAVAALMTANLVLAGRAVLSESSPVFLLARLIGDGPARDYLAEACPERGYLLCGRLDDLGRAAPGYPVSDYFLWHRQGARHAFGDTPRFLAEASEIVRETVRTRPLDVLGHVVANGARQLARAGLDPTLNAPVKPWTRQFVSRFGAPVYQAFLGSRQFRQALPLDALNAVQAAVLGVAGAALVGLGLARGRRLGGRLRGLFGVVLLGLVLNAGVAGGLSAVHDRYQNRVVWLLPLAAMAAGIAIARRLDAAPALTPAARCAESG
ncbi:hypothetical protein [Azospirillum sp.]|uniref:hypothetical protein n=1 Tax=Azospirillum sp. TaxID=34012 RepID=UPI003D73E0FC